MLQQVMAKALDIQSQLSVLTESHAAAHTELLQRLAGMSASLGAIASMALKAGNVEENSRLTALQACVEASIDADLLDDDVFCGRSRRRLDNVKGTIAEAQRVAHQLQQVSAKQRQIRNFSGAQEVDKMFKSVGTLLNDLRTANRTFSFFDDQDEPGEFEEKIAREGSSFLTANYLFLFESGDKRHTVGCLAVIAATGAI